MPMKSAGSFYLERTGDLWITSNLKHLLSQHEQEHPGTHLIACITFASFGSTAKKLFLEQPYLYHFQ